MSRHGGRVGLLAGSHSRNAQRQARRPTALITGASSGIGLALAREFARAGYRATMRGSVTMVPGAVNKLLAFLGELPPRGISQWMFGILSRTPRAVPDPL
jgi:hypothetical protein